MQTITYGGDSTVAVDGVFRELLDPNEWSPGDWYVQVTVQNVETDAVSQIDGWLIAFERKERTGCWVTIQPGPPDDDDEEARGEPVRIETEHITHLEIP